MTEHSCIPGYPGFRRIAVREDFLLITKSWGNALALHCAEMKTNEIIAYLRTRGYLLETGLPPEELLWFDLSSREAEAMTLNLQGHATYDLVLRAESRSKIPSLVQLGFLRTRWVARPYSKDKSIVTKTYRDIRGKRYIIVDDRVGHYEDSDGVMHSAAKEGFLVSRQFLLLIDQVNTALKALRENH